MHILEIHARIVAGYYIYARACALIPARGASHQRPIPAIADSDGYLRGASLDPARPRAPPPNPALLAPPPPLSDRCASSKIIPEQIKKCISRAIYGTMIYVMDRDRDDNLQQARSGQRRNGRHVHIAYVG